MVLEHQALWLRPGIEGSSKGSWAEPCVKNLAESPEHSRRMGVICGVQSAHDTLRSRFAA